MSTSSAPVHRFGRDTAVRELLKPLNVFLDTEGGTEVVINRAGEVRVEVGAGWKVFTAPELTDARLMSLVRAIATFADQDIGPRQPILSATLPDGQRIQVVVPPAVPQGFISLSIRLPSAEVLTLDDYQRAGAFDRFSWPDKAGNASNGLAATDARLALHLRERNLARFLVEAVAARRNIAVVGDTGSGKTTLMKTLCQSIPLEERIVTIEDVRELALPNHGNCVHLLYSRGGQGVADVTPADLIASCMRMRPDRVLLAELRGSEAFDFIKLLATGHSGSITSFHAESCALALERYTLMAKEHADAAIFDAAGLKRLVRLTLDIILHIRAEIVPGADGQPVKRRFVDEIWFDPVAKNAQRLEAAKPAALS